MTIRLRDVSSQSPNMAPLRIGISSIHYEAIPIPPFEAEIQGSVFIDENYDGVYNSNEGGLKDVKVGLYKDEDQNGIPEGLIDETLTDGNICFL